MTASPVPPSEEQGRWYDQLVKEGGRPLFPRDRIEEISSNPERYHSLLRPWAADPDLPQPEEDWRVFSKQVDSWHDFRRWQRDNRSYDKFDEDREFSVYADERSISQRINMGFSDPNDPEFLESARFGWDSSGRNERLFKRRYDWETSSGRTFPGYAEAAKQRLEKHGFVKTFQLLEDATLQDAWTTWVEYIEYHCWWLDTDLAMIERLQARYDAACKKLQEAGVLRDGETEESVCTGEAHWDRLMETTRAGEALDHAVRFLGPGLDTTDYKPAKPPQIQRAEALLDELRKRRDAIDEFCDRTKSYRKSTTRARHRRVLIPLLMEIASEIWDEEERKRGLAEPAEASEAALTNAEGRKKRARSDSDSSGLEPADPKETKRKRDSVAPPTTSSSQSHSADQTQMDAGDEQESEAPPKGSQGLDSLSAEEAVARRGGAGDTATSPAAEGDGADRGKTDGGPNPGVEDGRRSGSSGEDSSSSTSTASGPQEVSERPMQCTEIEGRAEGDVVSAASPVASPSGEVESPLRSREASVVGP